MTAEISKHYQGRNPSAIRKAQILFGARSDRHEVTAINVAIGNVSLPMHPAMRDRMMNLSGGDSPFADGVVKYTSSVGSEEAHAAFRNVISSAGADASALHCVITDGGSQAMELMILGVCGPGSDRPLLLLDPAYANYVDLAKRVAVRTVSIRRQLDSSGRFGTPDLDSLESMIAEHRPSGIVVIPADNPTGQFIRQAELVKIARVAVQHKMWVVSDEAYRQLHYSDEPVSSVWRITEAEVPGITGSRISIETASKVWNACGLRIGALVTDNAEFQARTVAEYTANLCANSIGQYIFGALAHVSHDELEVWYRQQRQYYSTMMNSVADGLRRALPGITVSRPEAALYSVIDVRELAPSGFESAAFVAFCAAEGRVPIEGRDHTLLVAPMGGFYASKSASGDPSATQMRIAYVEPPEKMALVPDLFARLFKQFLAR